LIVEVLETARFRLRPILEDDPHDRAAFCQLYTDPEVMARVMPALTRDAAGALFDRVVRWSRGNRPGHRFWMIDDRASGSAAGVAGFLRDGGEAEIGVLLRREWWNSGVSSETFVTLIAHGFGPMGLALISAERPDDDHARIIDRLLGRFGFRRTPERASAPGRCRWELPRSVRTRRQTVI